MTLAFWYWFILILSLLFGGFGWYRTASGFSGVFWRGFGWNILLFLLFVVIGLKLFGGPFDALVK